MPWAKSDFAAGSRCAVLPPSSPTHSEDEGDEQDSSAEVAAALLGLASNNPLFNDQGDNVEGHEDDPTQVWEGDL